MDRRPEGYQPHPPEIWLFVCEAEQRSGADSVVSGPEWCRICGRWVVHRDQSILTSCLSNDLIGDTHKRRRRVIAPGFGPVEAKGFLPHIMDAVTKAREPRLRYFGADAGPWHQMADKWSSIVESSTSGHSAIIDVNAWLGKATLDACVLFSEFCMRMLRVNHKLISQKDRCWRVRLRLRCLGRYG